MDIPSDDDDMVFQNVSSDGVLLILKLAYCVDNVINLEDTANGFGGELDDTT